MTKDLTSLIGGEITLSEMYTIRINELCNIDSVVDDDMYTQRLPKFSQFTCVVQELVIGHVFFTDLDAVRAAAGCSFDDLT